MFVLLSPSINFNFNISNWFWAIWTLISMVEKEVSGVSNNSMPLQYRSPSQTTLFKMIPYVVCVKYDHHICSILHHKTARLWSLWQHTAPSKVFFTFTIHNMIHNTPISKQLSRNPILPIYSLCEHIQPRMAIRQ